jgi:hypothetical protein
MSHPIINSTKVQHIITDHEDKKLIYFSFPEQINTFKLLNKDYELQCELQLFYKSKNILIWLTDSQIKNIKYLVISETQYTKDLKHYVQYVANDIPHLKQITFEKYIELKQNEKLIDIDEHEYKQETELLNNQNRKHEYNEYESSIAIVEHKDFYYVLSELEFNTKIENIIKMYIDNDVNKIDKKRYKKFFKLDTEVINSEIQIHRVEHNKTQKYESEVQSFESSYQNIELDKYSSEQNNIQVQSFKSSYQYIIDKDKLVFLFSPRMYFLIQFIQKANDLNILMPNNKYFVPFDSYHIKYAGNDSNEHIRKYMLRFCSTFIDPDFGDNITLSDACIFNFKELFYLNEICITEDNMLNVMNDIDEYITNIMNCYLEYITKRSEFSDIKINSKQKAYIFEQSFLDFENEVLSAAIGNSKLQKRIKTHFTKYKNTLNSR